MKTMYRVEARVYTDCEGRYSAWRGRTAYTTYEDAEAATKNIVRKNDDTGDWRIVARTIDEEAFTVTDEIIVTYDWWKEIGEKEDAKRSMKIWEEEIERAKAIKARSEKGEAKKAKAITRACELYEYYKGIVEG